MVVTFFFLNLYNVRISILIVADSDHRLFLLWISLIDYFDSLGILYRINYRTFCTVVCAKLF